MAVDYDLVIIGGGSAGLVAASAGAQLKGRVALVEKEKRGLGGDCLFYGCVPSKSMIHSAKIAHDAKHAQRFGVHANVSHIDFEKAMGHVHDVVGTIAIHDSTERFESLGVEVIYGEGEFTDDRTFTVNGRELRARGFIIATGSHPALPPVDGLKEAGYLNNVDIFSDLKFRPDSLAVIGAGPIGCELGQSFARLGADVTIIASRDQIMPKEESEAAAVVQKQLESEGIRILTKSRAQRVEVIDGKKHLYIGDQKVVVDEILLSTGRVPNVGALGLEAAGVEVGKAGVKVNEKLQTSVKNIYGAGDVIGGYQFTHVAGYEAAVVIQNALFLPTKKADYRVIPWATFTEPELARVGLPEPQARERYGDDVAVLRQDFKGVDRALAEAAGYGFAKFITRQNGEILGAHIVGAHAGELIHEVVLAMSYKMKIGAIKSIIHVYPTLSEVNAKAALQLTKQSYAKNNRLQNILRMFFNWRRSLV